MPITKITSRRTKGHKATGFAAAAVAYTSATTFKAFGDTATVGAVGIFKLAGTDEGDATRVTSALSAGDKFFFAQILSKSGSTSNTPDGIKKSPVLDFGSLPFINYAAFSAPVLQSSYVGYDGTKGDFETSTGVISRYDDFEVAILDMTTPNLPYPTWSYSFNAKSNSTTSDIAFGIAAKVNDPLEMQNKEYGSIVSAEVVVEGISGTSITITVEQGSNAAVTSTSGIAPGTILKIGAEASYEVVSSSGTNVVLSSNYVGKSESGVSAVPITGLTNIGIKFTALYEGVHFRIATKGELEDTEVSYVVPFTVGSGGRDEVARFEYEANVFGGETTGNAEFAERYGEVTNFTSSSYAYDVFKLSYKKEFKSTAIPNTVGNHLGYVELIAPLTSGAPSEEGYEDATASPVAAIKTALGL
jgi:hypothetical protein